jgi:hypothetical protein
MPYDVFISHTKEDEKHADAARAALESAGLKCWIAPRDIDAGKDWGAEIIKAITNSRAMLVVFSSHANNSNHITREVNQADEKGLSVVTFRVENVDPEGSLEYFLDSKHWLDAFPRPREKHAQLVRAIKLLLSEAAVVLPPEPRERTTFPKWVLAAVVGLLAVVAVVVLVNRQRRDVVVSHDVTPTPAPTQASPTVTPVIDSNHNSNVIGPPPPTPSPIATQVSLPDATAERITQVADVLLRDDSSDASRRDAINELEQLAKKGLNYNNRVVGHLIAFIRKQTIYNEPCLARPARPLPDNVQTALTVLSRRLWWFGHGETELLNLEGTDLRGANFMRKGSVAHFEGVLLRSACLDNAKMMDADFRCANLSGASVSGIDVNNTNFNRANLGGLRNANETEINMAQRGGDAVCPQ